MIRAIIFDCFGVLYRSSADELYSRCPIDRRDELHDIRLQRDRGIISYHEYLDVTANLLSMEVDEVRQIAETSHVRNQELFDFIRTVDRERYSIGMLSNIGDTTIGQLFSDKELDELFDATVFSYDVGMVKPDPAIFKLMCDKIGFEGEECLMIDDIEHNCEGARSVGMQAIQHVSNLETLEVLRGL